MWTPCATACAGCWKTATTPRNWRNRAWRARKALAGKNARGKRARCTTTCCARAAWPDPRMRLPAPAQQLAIRIALVLLACSLAGWVEWQRPQLLARFDETLRDLLHQVSAKHEPESRVAVIDIDEASLQAMGPWPWPRQRMADLLEILLTTYRVRAIGVDILFPEPADPAGDARLAML